MLRSHASSLAVARDRAPFPTPARDPRVLLDDPVVAVADVDGPIEHEPIARVRSWHRLVVTRTPTPELLERAGAGDAGSALAADPVQLLWLAPGDAWPSWRPGVAATPRTVVAIEPDVAAAALRAGTPSFTHAHGAPSAELTASPAALLRSRQLRQALLRPRSTRDEAALEIRAGAARLFQEVAALPCRAPRPAGPRPAPRRRAIADHAIALLLASPGRPHSLGDTARALGISASHLAHVFRDEMGLPIHQYLLHLRLAIALDRLTEGDGRAQLSRLALDLGFASHSHFSAVFRKAMGVPPVALRRRTATRYAAHDSTPHRGDRADQWREIS